MAVSHLSVVIRTTVLVTKIAVQVTSMILDTNKGKTVTSLEVTMTTSSQVLLLITNKDKTGIKVTQSQHPGGEIKLTQSQHPDGEIKVTQSQLQNGIKLTQSQHPDGGIKVMQNQHQNGIKLIQSQHPDGGINSRNQIMTNMAQVRQIILQET